MYTFIKLVYNCSDLINVFLGLAPRFIHLILNIYLAVWCQYGRTLYTSSPKTFPVPRVITWSSLNWAIWQWHQPGASWIKNKNRIDRGFVRRSHASLRTGRDPEGDAAAGDSGCSPADSGDFDGAGCGGEGPGEPGGATAALQDNQTQPEAQPRDLLSGRFPRGPRHPHGLAGSPAPRCGRGEAHCAEEGRRGSRQQQLWPTTVIECKEWLVWFKPSASVPTMHLFTNETHSCCMSRSPVFTHTCCVWPYNYSMHGFRAAINYYHLLLICLISQLIISLAKCQIQWHMPITGEDGAQKSKSY